MKWILSTCSWVTDFIARLAFTEFHFRAPKPGNLKIRESARDDVLEVGPQWGRLRRDGGLVAGAETGLEGVNVPIRARESSQSPARDEKISGAESRGRHVFRISVLQKADPYVFRTGVS